MQEKKTKYLLHSHSIKTMLQLAYKKKETDKLPMKQIANHLHSLHEIAFKNQLKTVSTHII